MRTSTLTIAGLVVLGVWVFLMSVFWVDEGELALITQFGEPKRTVMKPGLQFKTPFITDVRRMPRRILGSDTPFSEFLTSDKKKIVADPITRWRIVDPLVYYSKLGSVENAKQRIDDIINSELRRIVANRSFEDIVGERRGPMMEEVTLGVRKQTKPFGLHVIDVRIKRADLPRQVEQSVFERMTAEREKVAKQYRAEGQEKALVIRSETDRQVKVLLAEAYETSQKARGEGDALATKIYAEAYDRDPELYSFKRSLDSYERSLDASTTLVLSSDSELFRYLRRPGK